MKSLFFIIIIIALFVYLYKQDKSGRARERIRSPISHIRNPREHRQRPRHYRIHQYPRFPRYEPRFYQHPYIYPYIERNENLKTKGYRCERINKNGVPTFVPVKHYGSFLEYSKEGYDSDITDRSVCNWFTKVETDDTSVKCRKGSNDIKCREFGELF